MRPATAGLGAANKGYESFSKQHREMLAMGHTAAGSKKNKSKARITVVVRKRPLATVELNRHEMDILQVTDSKTKIQVDEPRKNVCGAPYVESHAFSFDRAYTERHSNRQVYDSCVKQLVDSVFEQGAWSSCFAYGQTGSGKTFTMVGGSHPRVSDESAPDPGILEMAARDCFRWLREPAFDYHLGLHISFFEIYCNKVYDLLNERRLVKALETKTADGVVVKDLTSRRVENISEFLQTLNVGLELRVVGSNSKNTDSSRGHAILTFELKNQLSKVNVGKLAFIDLAGSERGADAMFSGKQTQQDGAGINRSLLALKECIRALDQQSSHVPFRDSELTKVLRDMFITSKARTLMISCVSPSSACCEQTLNTLRYADRVKSIRRNCKPDVNYDDCAEEQPRPVTPPSRQPVSRRKNPERHPEPINRYEGTNDSHRSTTVKTTPGRLLPSKLASRPSVPNTKLLAPSNKKQAPKAAAYSSDACSSSAASCADDSSDLSSRSSYAKTKKPSSSSSSTVIKNMPGSFDEVSLSRGDNNNNYNSSADGVSSNGSDTPLTRAAPPAVFRGSFLRDDALNAFDSSEEDGKLRRVAPELVTLRSMPSSAGTPASPISSASARHRNRHADPLFKPGRASISSRLATSCYDRPLDVSAGAENNDPDFATPASKILGTKPLFSISASTINNPNRNEDRGFLQRLGSRRMKTKGENAEETASTRVNLVTKPSKELHRVFPPKELDTLKAAAEILRRKYRDLQFPLFPLPAGPESPNVNSSSRPLEIETAMKMIKGLRSMSPRHVMRYSGKLEESKQTKLKELVLIHETAIRDQGCLSLSQQKLQSTIGENNWNSATLIELRRITEAGTDIYLTLGKRVIELERLEALHDRVLSAGSANKGSVDPSTNGR